jgi:hypothetical protein
MTSRVIRLRALLPVAMLALAGCTNETWNTGSGGHWDFPDGSLPDGTVDDASVIPDACVPQPEVCDGLDNDCDGLVDETESGLPITDRDPENCGTCGHVCDFPHALASCVDGDCVMDGCMPGYWDLDEDQDTGCEYPCLRTSDGTEICDGRDNDCDGLVDEDFDLDSDPDHCGECYNHCTFLHGIGGCVAGQCAVAACEGAFRDADGNGANGCECLLDVTEGTVACDVLNPVACGPGEVCVDPDRDEVYHCSPMPAEICDTKDNDCNGLVDGADDLSADLRIGIGCYGDPDGLCATAAHEGQTSCDDGQVVCTGAGLLRQNQVAETCNGVDDDCDGIVDDNTAGSGASCGVNDNFPCRLGTMRCVGANLACVGAVLPGTESCNGLDDDCDGRVDLTTLGQPPADAVGACNIPAPPPPGATSPCQAGSLACVNGQVLCQGSVGPSSSADQCGDDSNCDGVLTNQPDLLTDVRNCGTCGHDCTLTDPHGVWSCSGGGCMKSGCQYGWYDWDADGICDDFCIPTGAETCDGVDNDCDGQVDEGLVAPPVVNVCGTSPAASRAECTTGVTVACQGGQWRCTFPAGVCNPTCAATAEICDNLDNDCDGLLNENVTNYGKPCTVGVGACQNTGTYICATASTTTCSVSPLSCAPNCAELCDGIDNDCDGSVDEPYSSPGTNATYYVKPTVTKIGTSRWIYSYEASRPSATTTSPGTGNGYHCSGATCAAGVPTAPAGVTLDRTYACSLPAKIPWINVTPVEAEQTCSAMGGFLCSTTDWQTACEVDTNDCEFAYAPRGAACDALHTASKYCNLGYYDFSGTVAGDQDGLLVTASALLQNCWADWSNLQGNTAATNRIYDMTGNLRELTETSAGVYTLLGGSFVADSEDGAACLSDFYAVDSDYAFYDTGFRCCFSTNPSP